MSPIDSPPPAAPTPAPTRTGHSKPNVITEDAAVQRIAAAAQGNHHDYCFFLGAGASVTSGIPSGWELAKKWLREMFEATLNPHQPTQDEWEKDAQNGLGIPGFDPSDLGRFYSQIYDKRFVSDTDAGHDSLRKVMDQAVPNVGYAALSRLLREREFNLVFTTNFDRMIERALELWSQEGAKICGHPRLADGVTSSRGVPIVAKVHNDLYFEPVNSARGVASLAPEWKRAIKAVFKQRTPLFLGYAGNDGSVMDYLESKLPRNGMKPPMMWCFHSHRSGPDNERVRRVVERFGGQFVQITGFDPFILKLAKALNIPVPTTDDMRKRADKLAQQYDDRCEKYRCHGLLPASPPCAPKPPGPRREPLSAETVLATKILHEHSPERRKQLVREGLQRYPNSALFQDLAQEPGLPRPD